MTKSLVDVIVQVATCTSCELSSQCLSPVPLSSAVPRGRSLSRASKTSPMLVQSAVPYIVVGEAPGRIEDRERQAFVGPAGMYLRKSLDGVGLDSNKGTYMNVVSCWPHGSPTPSHIAACRGNLFDQLQVCDEKYVLVCGSVALKSLMPNADMKNVMGRPIPIHNKVIFPIQHPSFIAFKAGNESKRVWHQLLVRFRALLEERDANDWVSCLYCERRSVEVKSGERTIRTLTCYRHKELWRKDSYWKPGSVQGELF